MEKENIMGHVKTFIAPSGFEYTIREQNGADDDILSNPSEARDLTNLSRFIASVVVDTDFTTNRKLSLEDAKRVPVLDRYCILFQSRMFSIGEEIDFEYDWGENNGGKVGYTQDLNEFLFDYSGIPTDSELNSKPSAIPFYSNGKNITDIHITTHSGKEVMFDLMNGESEAYLLTLPLDKRTKNQELVARNLRLKVGERYEKVSDFSLFSLRDMVDIRKVVATYDPIFSGMTDVENPLTGEKAQINIIAIPGFFYPEEI